VPDDNIKITVDEKSQPNLRKLARALISLATRLQEQPSSTSANKDSRGGESPPEVAA